MIFARIPSTFSMSISNNEFSQTASVVSVVTTESLTWSSAWASCKANARKSAIYEVNRNDDRPQRDARHPQAPPPSVTAISIIPAMTAAVTTTAPTLTTEQDSPDDSPTTTFTIIPPSPAVETPS
nr:unnamed protein product [Spirometra erinaceieuropaei]